MFSVVHSSEYLILVCVVTPCSLVGEEHAAFILRVNLEDGGNKLLKMTIER
jgi:hypothetical protein